MRILLVAGGLWVQITGQPVRSHYREVGEVDFAVAVEVAGGLRFADWDNGKIA